MTEVSFSRFFKTRTGITFIDSLTELRLGHASQMLIDTLNRFLKWLITAALIISPILTASLKRKKDAHQKNSGKTIVIEAVYLFNMVDRYKWSTI